MKVLMIRLGSLGDVVLTTPLPEAIKKAYPDAEVDYLVKKEYVQILEQNPYINKLIPFDSKGTNKGLNGLLLKIKELKEGGYTHILDLHSNLRSRLIAAMITGADTLRYKKQLIKRRLLLRGVKVDTIHTVDAYFGALSSLGINRLDEAPGIYLSEDDADFAERFLKDHQINRGETILGINPGATRPTKMWTEEGFVETGRRCVKEIGAKILIFGGPDEMELGGRIAERIGDHALSVAGKMDLKESAALIKRCRIFISNDSGPMHMATAVETPVVAIFGPTVQGFGFAPIGNSTVVEVDLKCRPCSLHGSKTCPRGHFECMNAISADTVFEKVKEILADKKMSKEQRNLAKAFLSEARKSS